VATVKRISQERPAIGKRHGAGHGDVAHIHVAHAKGLFNSLLAETNALWTRIGGCGGRRAEDVWPNRQNAVLRAGAHATGGYRKNRP
jgi:hypothetical protein